LSATKYIDTGDLGVFVPELFFFVDDTESLTAGELFTSDAIVVRLFGDVTADQTLTAGSRLTGRFATSVLSLDQVFAGFGGAAEDD
jgi:hypothetical protein